MLPRKELTGFQRLQTFKEPPHHQLESENLIAEDASFANFETPLPYFGSNATRQREIRIPRSVPRVSSVSSQTPPLECRIAAQVRNRSKLSLSPYTLFMPLELRRVTDPHDSAIIEFGRLQSSTYFEPEMLIPAAYIGQMLAGDGTRQNALLVVEDAERVVAGTLFHFLAASNVGFSSYLAVAQNYRGRGLARRLHEARRATLMEISNGLLHGVLIDVVNPSRLSTEDIRRERSVGSDPVERLRAFSHLGFKRVDVRYEQPTGGQGGSPVTNMDLLFCPVAPATTVSTDLVADTMRAYWTPWLGARTAEREARALQARAGGSQIGLLELL
jgi:GNAT superfamily N-acetyltransferase